MRLDPLKYREVVSKLGPQPAQFCKPPSEFSAWLAQKNLPPDLVQFLLDHALRDEVPFADGCGGMWTPQDVMCLNDQESAILAAGLLALGNATNGDFIVVDFAKGDGRSGFVSHDELWGKPPADVRDIFVAAADSLDELLNGMSSALWELRLGKTKKWNYPTDYCQALTGKRRT